MTSSIYLDYNATTPLASEVMTAISETCRDHWANPSSSYESGRAAKAAVEGARERIAELIKAEAKGIVFTSGGTESNSLAIHSAIKSYSQRTTGHGGKPHIITTNIEHPAIELPLMRLLDEGVIELSIVPVTTSSGIVNPEDVISQIKPNTCLISVMMANNETGILQPISEIFDRVKSLNMSSSRFPILCHTDAAQAVGKIHVDVNTIKADYVTIVGHKFYGPRIGALYASSHAPITPLFFGGGQEDGRRAGTENTPMIVGLGKAAQLAEETIDRDIEHSERLRDRLVEKLQTSLGTASVQPNFSSSPRLPNTCSLSFPGINGGDLAARCRPFLEFSTSAACHSGSAGSAGSPILLKSGLDERTAVGTIRLSVGRYTTVEEIDKAADILIEAFEALLSKVICHA